MDTSRTRPRGPITLLMTGRRFRLWAAIAMLPGLYLGSYWLLLERKAYYVVVVEGVALNPWEIEPQYRLSAPWVESAMGPALWFDRHLRHDYWTTVVGASGGTRKIDPARRQPVPSSMKQARWSVDIILYDTKR